MNDQVTPAVEGRRRSAAPWLILALVVILAAVGVWFLTAKRVPEGDPAGFLPKDCMMAITFDFTSSPDKQAALDVVEGIFKDAGIDDMEAFLFKQMSKEAEVDVQKDIMPKLSRTAGFAMLPAMVGMMQPEMVMVSGAKSEADAAALVKLIVDAQKKKDKNVAEATYEGVKFYKYADGMTTTCIGAVKNAFVTCNSESAFKKACDTISGRSPSLLEQSTYMSLREIKPSTCSTMYFSGPSYYKGLIEPMMAMGGGQIPADITKTMADLFNGLEAVAMTDVNGDGVTFRQKCRVPEDWSGSRDALSLDELASIAPEDAAFAYSVIGVNTGIAEMKKRFLSGETVKTQVDQAVQQVKMMAGFDLFADALDRITGLGVYFVPRPAGGLSEMPGHIVVVLTVDKPPVIQSTLTKIKGLMAMQGGVGLPEVQIAGQTVTMIPSGPGSPKMGFTLVGDKLLFAITQKDIKDAMTGAIRVTQKKAASLASSGSFGLVKKLLPAQSSGLIYADAEPIVELVKPEMDAQGKKIADAITRRVGPMGLAAEGSGNEIVVQAVVPFKK